MSPVYFDDVGDIKLDRVTKLLAGIPDGVYRAVGSAIKRAAQHGLSVGMKIVSGEYAISQGELKRRTKNINTVVKDGAGSYEVTFGYRGNVIPLIRFDTRIDRSGRVSTRVLDGIPDRSSSGLYSSCRDTYRIFERETNERFPSESCLDISSSGVLLMRRNR